MQNLHEFSDIYLLQRLLKSYHLPRFFHAVQGHIYLCLYLCFSISDLEESQWQKLGSTVLVCCIELNFLRVYKGLVALKSYLKQVKVMGEVGHIVIFCRTDEYNWTNYIFYTESSVTWYDIFLTKDTNSGVPRTLSW